MKVTLTIFITIFLFNQINSNITFDFRKSSPLDLLDCLVVNSEDNFFAINPDSVPSAWLKKEDIPLLMKRIESEKITTPVFSTNAGVDLNYKNRTTEGVEALFMIKSIREKKRYPSALSSKGCGVLKNGIYYPDTTLIIEVKSWYKSFKK